MERRNHAPNRFVGDTKKITKTSNKENIMKSTQTSNKRQGSSDLKGVANPSW
jgi:hypothetical protein